MPKFNHKDPVTFDYEGDTYKGQISIDNDGMLFLCSNVANGCPADDKL